MMSKKLTEDGKLNLVCALLLLKEYKQQCLGVDWLDAAQQTVQLAKALDIKKEYSEMISSFPHVKIIETNK